MSDLVRLIAMIRDRDARIRHHHSDLPRHEQERLATIPLTNGEALLLAKHAEHEIQRHPLFIGHWDIIPTRPGKIIIKRVDDHEWMETDETHLEATIADFYARNF